MTATLPQPIPSMQSIDTSLLENVILPQVFKPGRYLGLEQGAYRKPFDQAHATMAIAFPDLYEIGASNYAIQLFYSLVNQHPAYLCDRIYAAAPDFKAKLAEYGMPLYGVESMRPMGAFDLVAFTLQYELNYTTILGMLESAGLPLRAAERPTLEMPIIIGGGPGSANPLPLAPFFDAFINGDGEEILIEILDLMAESKRRDWDKPQLMAQLAEIPGIYIPGQTKRVDKRMVDIAKNPVDMAPLVPMVEVIHDRVTIEARRGCDRMCRFCQPCFINLPVREQNIDTIRDSALKEIEKTGYEECSLLSLSIADYSQLKPLVMEVSKALKTKNASLSLPSQRADRFTLEVAEAVQQVRKSTLTFAPEAGTPRLRDVINKNLTDAEIERAVTTAYRAGWNKVKLYFIIGLPTETEDDLLGIVEMVRRLQDLCRQIMREPGVSLKKNLEVNVTLSNFVAKPHTPFQWFPQDSMEMLRGKIAFLRDQFRGLRGVKVNYTDPEISKLEAVIARGDDSLAEVLETAYRKGAYLDAWDDPDNFKRWFEALEEHGMDPEVLTRESWTDPAESLPWDVMDMGLAKSWLKQEYEKAMAAASTTPCFEACSTCGVCPSYGTWPTFTDDLKPATKAAAPAKVLPVTPVPVAPRYEPTAHNPSAAPLCRFRVILEKQGPMRFISHLDWLRLVQKVVIRSGLPIAYSQGFNPKPKISFGPALPLFMASAGEAVDISLTRIPESIEAALQSLNRYLPEGGRARTAVLLPPHGLSIDASLVYLEYQARPLAPLSDPASWPPGEEGSPSSTLGWTCKTASSEYTIGDRVRHLAQQPSLQMTVETKRSRLKHSKLQPNNQTPQKSLDIAPYLADLRTLNETDIAFKLRRRVNEAEAQPVHIKPEWVLRFIDPVVPWAVTRTGLYLASDPDFQKPLPSGNNRP